MKNIKSAVVYLMRLREKTLEKQLAKAYWDSQKDEILEELLEVRNFLYNGKQIKIL